MAARAWRRAALLWVPLAALMAGCGGMQIPTEADRWGAYDARHLLDAGEHLPQTSSTRPITSTTWC